MPIIASKKGNSNPISEGVHLAVCTRVIDLGDQYSKFYDKSNRKISICWEIPDETIEVNGEPMPRMISRDYTLSLGEKAVLRQHLESWRGKKFTEEELEGFDLENVLGKACQIQVMHNDKGYAGVSTVMSLPKGTMSPKPATELIYFDFNPDCFQTQLEKLPDFVVQKIKASPQYDELVNGKPDVNGFIEIEDDTLPWERAQ